MSAQISLNVYQRPPQGTGFVRRYGRLSDYRHRIIGVGGCDTASCTLAVTPGEAEFIFENYIGCAVNFYAKNPAFPIWQGMISRITYEYGNVSFTRSIEEMANKALTSSYNQVTGVMQQTTATEVPASEAIYGIKSIVIDGLTQNSAAVERRNNIAAARLATRSYPQTSSLFSAQGNTARVRIECVGYYKTLDWELYLSTVTTGGITVATIVGDALAALSNGATFFDNTDTSLIVDTGYNFNRYNRSGMTTWQYCQYYQEGGDGVTPWVMGMTIAQNPADRQFYFRAQNRVATYTATVKRSPGVIRNLYGGVVPPYEVQPDCLLTYTDILVGWNAIGSDPRQLYVEAVDFDGNKMQATVQGNDDLTYDGAMKVRKLYKESGIRTGMNNQVRQYGF